MYYNDGSLYQAVDLRTQIDNMYIRPVYAAEDGTVDQTQDWDGHTRTGMQSYGNMVRIKHAPYNGKTLQMRYAHLSSYCVKVGQKVKEGELIGYSGVTGNVFGAHLHFEVILNGKRTQGTSTAVKQTPLANKWLITRGLFHQLQCAFSVY